MTTTTYEARVAAAVKDGWRVETASPTQSTLVKGRRPNHVLHLLLSVFTLGLWLPVWLIVALAAGEQRRVISAVNEAAETMQEKRDDLSKGFHWLGVILSGVVMFVLLQVGVPFAWGAGSAIVTYIAFRGFCELAIRESGEFAA